MNGLTQVDLVGTVYGLHAQRCCESTKNINSTAKPEGPQVLSSACPQLNLCHANQENQHILHRLHCANY